MVGIVLAVCETALVRSKGKKDDRKIEKVEFKEDATEKHRIARESKKNEKIYKNARQETGRKRQ